MQDYSLYYDRPMQSHKVGFKLALGGTGLGKTNGVVTVCLAPQHKQRKSMYWANRIQLLEEMAQKLPRESYVMVHRDFDMVRFTLANHREAFYQFVREPFFVNALKEAAQRKLIGRNTDAATFWQKCEQLESYTDDELRRYKRLRDDAESLASFIFQSFRFLLISLHRSGKTKLHLELLDHPIIRSLFPYITFKRDPQIRLLLMTIHKAYYGFFDGFKTLNMTRLKGDDGGVTIFLDEFDFLEHDLISMICRAPQIENPFRFIDLFYQEMTRHRLPSTKYPFSDNVRNRIVLIMNLIKQLEKEKLPFPAFYKFTSTIPERSLIFRTRHTISTIPLYLFPTNRSFHLTKDVHDPLLPQGTTTTSATHLFNAISQICTRILMLFKELEEEDEIIYREVLRHCFESTDFLEQVPQITHFSQADQLRQRTQLGALLETGYDIYDIKELQQQTDPDEVDVEYYSVNLTPEKLLYSLAQHNLVFGLSATADIARLVHHFHLDWLRQQEVEVLDMDEEDRSIIHALNQEKASKRDNKLLYIELQELDSNDSYQEKLTTFISSLAQHEEFGKDSGGYRKQRVSLFFSTLLWLLQQPATNPRIPSFDPRTCLLFLNSFQQIKLVFEHHQQPEEGLFHISKLTSINDFDAYEITLLQQTVIVAFYNAQAGNRARQNSIEQQFNQMFWKNKPVVVVTQYLSAGNGVNLQYLPHPNAQKEYDFTSIGLLETPYFYFCRREEGMKYEEWIAAKKENVWYQAKLYTGKAITEHAFRTRLTTLETPDDWSSRYQHDLSTSYDALLNNMATFMQALGRVERVWHEMPDQTVLFSKEVHQRFLAFAQEEYDYIRQEREAIISNNLRMLFLQVQQTYIQRKRDVRKTRDATFIQKNTRCKLLIEPLLKRLEQLRQGQQDADIRKIWQQLRQLALQHQFSHSLLKDFGCVAESPYYEQGKLYITPQQEIIPISVALPGTRCWEMNALYEIIAENPVIRDYFLLRGYELAFGTTTRQFFVPYFYQAILTGAIGEEAIVALLNKAGITLEEVPNALFEIADLKLTGRPWYIDCKYYNEYTLENFSVPPGDSAWRPKLNDEDFKKRAQEKLVKISNHHGLPGKLFYLNLVSRPERSLSLYNKNLDPVLHLQQADIIVVPGALERTHPDTYHQVFTDVLAFLR